MEGQPKYEELNDLLDEGKNVLLTGPAGTGKTYALREIAKTRDCVTLTATTGIASVNLGGVTLHSYCGMGIHINPDYVSFLTRQDRWKHIKKRIQETELLVIDECSMLHRRVFELFSEIMAEATGYRGLPFGGKQILFSGDFLQLPPVDKTTNGIPNLLGPWMFDSLLWDKANIHIISFDKIFRQDDEKFIKALQEIRVGNCPDWVDDMMALRENATLSTDLDPVRFVPKNDIADKINFAALDKIDDIPKHFRADVHANFNNEHLKRGMVRDCLAPEKLTLKKGAQVMILVNDKNCEKYINGSMGVVVGYGKVGDDGVEVKLDKTGVTVNLKKHKWTKAENKKGHMEIIASMEQVPLRLAYAVTMHKSQGLTLDCAEVDLAGTFTAAQAYVALSRVRTLEGLKLKNWNKRYVWADENAIKFYESIVEEK